jgi:hypothetical protein
MLGHCQRRAFTREYTTDESRKSIPGKVARALPSSPLAAGLIPFPFSLKRAASECEPCPPGWPTRATCPRPAPAPRRHSRRRGAESHGHEAGKHQAEALLRPLSASGAVTAFPDLDGSGLSADCNYYRSSVPV